MNEQFYTSRAGTECSGSFSIFLLVWFKCTSRHLIVISHLWYWILIVTIYGFSGEGLSTLHRSRSRGESINAVGTRTASRNKWIPTKGFPHMFWPPHNDIITSHHLSRCWWNLTLNIHYCSWQNTFILASIILRKWEAIPFHRIDWVVRSDSLLIFIKGDYIIWFALHFCVLQCIFSWLFFF